MNPTPKRLDESQVEESRIKCYNYGKDCSNNAYHKLSYEGLADSVSWEENYCLECFVKKLRGMVEVWNDRIKKYCNNCQIELQDKRMKICDRCAGRVYIPNKEITH